MLRSYFLANIYLVKRQTSKGSRNSDT